ncbi:MAG: DNA mismatch repair protein MutS [Candidatus Aphodosoma sp.]
MTKPVETPLMKQYYEIKNKYPDAVLLFRVGDFYETFAEDAIRTSEILGITLTRRANGVAQYVELAGFPHHALDTYLPKLVRHGLRVAICDQLEDPKTTKGLVKRGITELVTPGVSTNDNVLEIKENNFLASVHITPKGIGASFLDISTGEFLLTEGEANHIEKIVSSFAPKELLYETDNRSETINLFGGKYHLQPMPEWVFTFESAYGRLLKHFDVKNLKGFGVENMKLGLVAAGSIIHYLDQTYHNNISHITTLQRIESDRYVWMDQFTIRNLELIGGIQSGSRTLCQVIDRTTTPMGGRMLRRWLLFPLKERQPIENRLAVVTHFFRDNELRQTLSESLCKIGDLERILSKAAVGRITPRELSQLCTALSSVGEIKRLCAASSDCEQLTRIADRLNPCEVLGQRIKKTLADDVPSLLSKGGVIADGVDNELDELRRIAFHGKDYLNQIQQTESARTGIPSLKIGYNNVFGYFIEVRNTHRDRVPSEWIRKQTLVNAERYITEELKQYEETILTAEEKIATIETRLFTELVTSVIDYISAIQVDCNEISQLDCLLSFALISSANRYNCPVIADDDVIDIKQGRHPVIEKQLPIGEEYVPNDVFLDNEKQQIMMITGPNMAGKSALLRQTALIVLMAQMGCFVPADTARIGLVDKIFTRVGANDNLSVGDSTFMVEMNEAASILNNMTDRSLVLFDELGRGTSTYDGISIAWAIVEYIHEHAGGHAKTLFATHYHELNDMERSYSRIKNYNVTVREVDKKIIFLRKLARGGSEHSFGIHVAKMAGMPRSIVDRANQILETLEADNKQTVVPLHTMQTAATREGLQLSMFQLDDPVLAAIRDEILGLSIDNLTPMEALLKLNEIKKIVTGRS